MPPEFFLLGFAWLVCSALCAGSVPLFPVPGQEAALQRSWNILLWVLKQEGGQGFWVIPKALWMPRASKALLAGEKGLAKLTLSSA